MAVESVLMLVMNWVFHVIGDTHGVERDIDHGNTSGTLDPDFLNPRFEKCALQMRLLTVISVRVLPMRSNHILIASGF